MILHSCYGHESQKVEVGSNTDVVVGSSKCYPELELLFRMQTCNVFISSKLHDPFGVGSPAVKRLVAQSAGRNASHLAGKNSTSIA